MKVIWMLGRWFSGAGLYLIAYFIFQDNGWPEYELAKVCFLALIAGMITFGAFNKD